MKYREREMKERRTDVAIIGAGSAGLAAFRAASKHTDDVLLIEGGEYGTTCARVGCMPSKLLIAAAEAAHAIDEAHAFGVRVGGVEIDGRAVMDRVRRERDRFVGFVVDGVEAIPAHKRMRGMAKFIDEHRIVVGEVSFEDQGRSRVMLKNKGLLRVYADRRDGRLLGAEMVGPRAEHIGHLLAWAHQQELGIADLLAMPFYHPVVEEGVRTALRDACRQLSDCMLRAA